MLKKTETILFATNFSDASRAAFNHAAVLATQLKAKIVLLHVIEKLPESYESRINTLFGKERWEQIIQQHFQEARNILIGKISSRQLIHTALEQFCREAGIDENQCGNLSTEVVIEQGDVANLIIQQAAEHQCDLIAMGASKGLISRTSLGSHIKSVMKKTTVPVLVIPPMSDG